MRYAAMENFLSSAVVPANPHNSTYKSNDVFDAIFIPTSGQRKLPCASQILSQFTKSSVYLVLSQFSENPIIYPPNFRTLYLSDLIANDTNNLKQAESHLNYFFSSPTRSFWDLGIKRTAVLRYARHMNQNRILMIDDDILPELVTLARCNRLSQHHPIVSAQPVQFPDHSIIGHIERSLNLRKSVFVSGSFLALHTDINHPVFPNLYNEDWLYFCNVLRSVPIVSVGSVKQRPYDPYAIPSLAGFQELGEILAEGLFLAKENRNFAKVFHSSYWREFLGARKKHLSYLNRLCISNPKDLRMVVAIDSALSEHKNIDASSLACFIFDYFHDKS